MKRSELTNALKNLRFEQASNIKFYKLLWTKLTENNIPTDDAYKIANMVDYDFSNVPEDNDSLGEFATEYAEYCQKVYASIKLNNIRDIAPFAKYFKSPVPLQIDGL
jgi:hypothetical protein